MTRPSNAEPAERTRSKTVCLFGCLHCGGWASISLVASNSTLSIGSDPIRLQTNVRAMKPNVLGQRHAYHASKVDPTCRQYWLFSATHQADGVRNVTIEIGVAKGACCAITEMHAPAVGLLAPC